MSIFNKPNLYLLLISLAPSGALFAQTSQPDLSVRVDYETALHWAKQTDPRLRALEARAEAAEGQIEQADLPPNPVVGAEAENFLGTGPYSGVDAIEITLGISQLIETADKREKRTALARRRREAVDWAREQRLADLEAEVRQAYVSVLLSQESLDLRVEQLALAQRSETETARLVELARAPEVELTRARLAVEQQRFALEQAEHVRAATRARLAITCGFPPMPAFSVEGSIVMEATLPDLIALQALLPSTARLARFDSIEATGRAALELEEAMATPDLEILAGGRYFNADDGRFGFVAGIQIPWPMFDRNQGNIRSARARLRAAEHGREATRRELLIALTSEYQNLVGAYREAHTVRETLIPGASQTLTDMETGYEQGLFNLLSVLESRRSLFEAREAHLDAISRYTLAQANIQSLTRPADTENPTNTSSK